MLKPWSRQLANRLLTTDPAQRLRLLQVGSAMLLMAVCVAVMHYVSWMGIAPRTYVWWWTLFALGGVALFYVLIRSGVTARFEDPALTNLQMVYAIAVGAVAYAMAGPVRGAALPTLVVVLMFGAFQLKPRTVGHVGVYAVLLYAAVMSFMAWRRPDAYLPWVEAGHFMILTVTVLTVSVLAARLARLRERLRRQRHELQQALARVQELSTRDELTGLVNRRYMVELLEQERQRCVRSGRTFCVALVDIDHFKQINDVAGHAAGDDVLRTFAREALAVVRMADVLARWGGDEFVLMLSDSRAPLARAGLERLRERIESLTVHTGGHDVRIALSIGLTEHIAGEAVAQAFERADRALYEAKLQGRNRVAML
jgi:diguanylate cyclase (GGDEF)-like protein